MPGMVLDTSIYYLIWITPPYVLFPFYGQGNKDVGSLRKLFQPVFAHLIQVISRMCPKSEYHTEGFLSLAQGNTCSQRILKNQWVSQYILEKCCAKAHLINEDSVCAFLGTSVVIIHAPRPLLQHEILIEEWNVVSSSAGIKVYLNRKQSKSKTRRFYPEAGLKNVILIDGIVEDLSEQRSSSKDGFSSGFLHK